MKFIYFINRKFIITRKFIKFLTLIFLIFLFLNVSVFESNVFNDFEFLLIENKSKLYIDEEVDYDYLLKSSCECRKNDVIKVKVTLENFQIETNKNKYNISKDEFEKSNFNCDLYNVLRRGKNQKVIGYSLYNKNLFYYKSLKKLSKLVKDFYPGWIIRVHYDSTIRKDIICEIECLKDDFGNYLDHVDFCNINELPKINNFNVTWNGSFMHGMSWRWLPIGDSFVDIFQSRDIETIIIQREVDSTNFWLSSDKQGHIMRGNLNIFYIVGKYHVLARACT